MKFFVQSNKGQREIILPTSWATCSTDKYIQMVTEWDSSDLVKLFSILSGIEYKTLSETKNPELEQQLIIATRFVYEEGQRFKDAPVPDYFTIEGKEIKVHKDVGGLSIGQNAKLWIESQNHKCYESLIPIAIAIYLEPDYDKALELVPVINKMPITETYPLGFFLLNPIIKSGQIISKRLNRSKTLWSNPFKKRGKTLQS